MNLRKRLLLFPSLCALCLTTTAFAQDAPPNAGAAPRQQGPRGNGEGQNGPRLFGKITAMQNGKMEVSTPDGKVVTVNLTSETEFRRDRQPAKIADFKVGDMVAVRGEENVDHTVTAHSIGARTGGPGAVPGGNGGGMFAGGTLGKDYVLGEVKAIDAPRITVLRTDNVTQTLELNEDTTLRRGRESITMADIQVGDHLAARGAVQNDVFVPKGVMVMNAEQWQRMQEFAGANGAKTGNAQAPEPKP